MNFLTITETAQRLRVTRWTIHRLLAGRDLTPVQVDGVRRVQAESVTAFLRRHAVVPERQEQTAVKTEVPTLYSLEEVVQMYPHLSLRTLADDARAKKFEHIHYGRRRLMTAEQIERMLAARTVRPAEDEALAVVRQRRSRRPAASGAGRRS